MKAISLEHAWRKPVATDRMAQLCSVMRQPAVLEPLDVGQVAVLVEDAGQLGHLLVEGAAGQAGAVRRRGGGGAAARTGRSTSSLSGPPR